MSNYALRGHAECERLIHGSIPFSGNPMQNI